MELAISQAWHNRNLHYVKTLPPLDEYLKPARPADRDAGAHSLREMIQRMKAKKEAQSGA